MLQHPGKGTLSCAPVLMGTQVSTEVRSTIPHSPYARVYSRQWLRYSESHARTSGPYGDKLEASGNKLQANLLR